ncbi:hypothetical protein CK507_01980 [Pseudomonas sp. WN033]|nr:hypothetical protein CK507_01980 [Pseudomonas sp. WN033]
MRLDGFSPFNALPERVNRPVAPQANSESARAGQTAPAAPVEPVKALASRPVNASSANAEYIPARRDSAEPAFGKANQALASYQFTANLPVDAEESGIFGIDTYA